VTASSGDLSAVSQATHINVPIAEYAVARDDAVLVTIGIGSCVAIVLWDRESRVGALAHILLPNELLTATHEPPAKAAATAVPAMVRGMRERASKGAIEARLVGGASMFGTLLIPGAISLGARNTAAARTALADAGIAVIGEDTGGDYGRSVYFDVRDGSVLVRTVSKGDVRL